MKGWVVATKTDSGPWVFLTKFGCLPLAVIEPPHHPRVQALTKLYRDWDQRVWSLGLKFAKRFTKDEAKAMETLLS